MGRAAHKAKWEQYRDTRQGTYDFRCRTRYSAVADILQTFVPDWIGPRSLMDVGSGTNQFALYLKTRGWFGTYIPVDAVHDGTDLETWQPPMRAAFVVCIETLEHLSNPFRLLDLLIESAGLGVVITTPNPEAVDVLACDPTHLSAISRTDLTSRGMTVETRSWFGVPNDTLIAWRKND